jgi:hypothetical protein
VPWTRFAPRVPPSLAYRSLPEAETSGTGDTEAQNFKDCDWPRSAGTAKTGGLRFMSE